MEDKKLKIYHVQGWTEYSNWVENKEIVDNIEDADLVWFEGGSDVWPAMYDENIHPTTGFDKQRDLYEKKIYETAKELNIKCWGTCRGSQFLCVMSGGKLVQHQNNPSFIHPINTYKENIILASSTHHQAQFPYNLSKEEYKILGWTENMLPFHQGGDREELNPEKECEIVYYPKTDCLGIQMHPEMLYPDEKYKETIEFCRELLNDFMNNKL